MTDRVHELGRILEKMLTENQPITARAVVRSSDGLFRHASDVNSASASTKASGGVRGATNPDPESDRILVAEIEERP